VEIIKKIERERNAFINYDEIVDVWILEL